MEEIPFLQKIAPSDVPATIESSLPTPGVGGCTTKSRFMWTSGAALLCLVIGALWLFGHGASWGVLPQRGVVREAIGDNGIPAIHAHIVKITQISGDQIHGDAINGDKTHGDKTAIKNRDGLVGVGVDQLKPCEGSGNDGSGAGAVGVVCCMSTKGGVACDHDHSGSKSPATKADLDDLNKKGLLSHRQYHEAIAKSELVDNGIIQKVIDVGLYSALVLKENGVAYGFGQYFTADVRGNEVWGLRYLADDVAAVSAGALHSLLLKANGDVYGVGLNSMGELGDTSLKHRDTPVKIMEDVKGLCAGNGASYYVKRTGEVFASGDVFRSDVPAGSYMPTRTPIQIEGLPNIVSVSCEQTGTHQQRHVFFLTQTGEVYGQGPNYDGGLGINDTSFQRMPVKVMEDVKAIATSLTHSLFLKKNGEVLSSGQNLGQLGHAQFNASVAFVVVPSHVVHGSTFVEPLRNIKSIAAGQAFSLFLDMKGSVYSVGSHGSEDGFNKSAFEAEHVGEIMDGVKAISAGYLGSLYLRENGMAMAAGYIRQFAKRKVVPLTDLRPVPVLSLTVLPGSQVLTDECGLHPSVSDKLTTLLSTFGYESMAQVQKFMDDHLFESIQNESFYSKLTLMSQECLKKHLAKPKLS